MGESNDVQGFSPLVGKVFSRINDGLGSFSLVGPLSFVDEYQSTNGIFYHFLCGEIPVACFGYAGKYAREHLVNELCRVFGEVRVNHSKDGGKAFINLSADSITKVYLPFL